MKKQLIIHIGLPKTGTTFLQKEVFPLIKDVDIISNEQLSGNPFKTRNSPDRLSILKSIKLLYPNAKIIIGIREYNSWINSLYSQYIKEGGILNFELFYENELIAEYQSDNFKSHMAYYHIYLIRSFKDVHVYEFEDLKQHPYETIYLMCKFMDVEMPNFSNVKHNVSWTSGQIKLARFFNHYFKSDFNPNGFFKGQMHHFFVKYLGRLL